MSIQKLSNNPTVITLLFASYVAIESYFLSMIFAYASGRFWLSNVVWHTVSVFAAYLLANIIAHKLQGGRRKKIIIATVILVGTIVFTVGFAIAALYTRKLQMQALYS